MCFQGSTRGFGDQRLTELPWCVAWHGSGKGLGPRVGAASTCLTTNGQKSTWRSVDAATDRFSFGAATTSGALTDLIPKLTSAFTCFWPGPPTTVPATRNRRVRVRKQGTGRRIDGATR